MFKFQTLDVWKKAIDFADMVVVISDRLPQRYQFSFGDQLRRAGLSIPSNIAEGNGRRTQNDSRNFYNIARGSLYECISILVVLEKRNLISWGEAERSNAYDLADEIVRMLSGLMRG